MPNVEICEILLYQSHLDFSYKLELLHVMKSFDIKPTEKFIEKLERSIQFARKKVIQKVVSLLLFICTPGFPPCFSMLSMAVNCLCFEQI